MLARLEQERFDLLVVGGGITGAAIAHRAASEKLRVALVEQNDFASGTSSRSSRLIHGGLRYLKQGQVRFVYRCLREQQRLAHSAPHLVRPLKLLLPLYRQSSTALWAKRGGMALYRALQPAPSGLFNKRFDASDMLAQEPLLPANALQGGFMCREYLTHDARLVWETVLAAKESGACALNYLRLVEFLTCRGRIVGGLLRDELTGRTLEVQARVLVNTTGPWSDKLTSRINASSRRLRLTKGVHLVLPRRLLPLSSAVVLFSPRDGRPLVAIPAENMVVVGPTETEYEGLPGEARPEREDTEYLLEALKEFFPECRVTPEDTVARAGLRPLYDKRAGRPAGEVSRAYHIEWQREGLLSVLGGKLTLHRQAATEALDVLSRKLNASHAVASKKRRASLHLPGAVWHSSPESVTKKLLDAGVRQDSVEHLLSTYGSRALLFVELLAEDHTLRERIIPPLPHIRAEAVFSMRYEMATCAEDFMERRTDLMLRAKVEGCFDEVELEDFWHPLQESAVVCV
ncbi:MAG TPA: glycerol-3-phosphate dehydrogenase/oxidase [Pyrinomonadaceae bacterium]|nr:glycerol-3-phosphate dehydrogenase/oxidase [Pyrinomonadaceae bacterium]